MVVVWISIWIQDRIEGFFIVARQGTQTFTEFSAAPGKHSGKNDSVGIDLHFLSALLVTTLSLDTDASQCELIPAVGVTADCVESVFYTRFIK